jgi:hypothetical protein
MRSWCFWHTELVSQVRARAVRWVSDDFPGWVEVHLGLANGTVAKLIDKWPVFTAGDCLRPDASYPVDLTLACEISAAEGGTAAGTGAVYVTLLHACDPSGEATSLVRGRDILPGD